MPIVLDKKSKEALSIMENSWDHIFLTGNAGTGKSTLLDHFRQQTKKNIAVVAPTGVAAVNVKGETIHSFFLFPPNVNPERAKLEAKKLKNSQIYKVLETLVIDEISMVRADLLDSINVFLQTVRKNNSSFGGVQIIMVGDLYQLPPVVTREEQEAINTIYRSPYFFSSKVFCSLIDGLYCQIKYIELSTIFRQTDKDFVDILNRVRHNQTSKEDIAKLNQHQVEGEHYLENHIYLTATNEQADKINLYKLNEIEGQSIVFKGTTSGSFSEKQFPAADLLELKTGSRVMLLNNDPKGRWINGTLGTLFQIRSDHVLVKLDNGELETVEPVTWMAYKTRLNPETLSLESKEVGSFRQIPLRLAWAITIHKSQGKTFEKVAIDLGRGAFAHGQTYVALSRCTTLSGLKLVRPLESSSIIMDDRVTTFLERIKQ
ncbi:MAG TPA: AAA family ATPase [Candidatus Woesebacteria bacterium]|nr:AAA family ATPase [Candidatus Woesebacteria bacterium]